MDPLNATAPSSRHTLMIRWAIAIVAVIIVAAVFFGGYGGLQRLTGMFGVATPATVPSDLQGLIFLSLSSVSTSTGSSTGILPVVVSVANGAIKYEPADQLTSGPAMTLQYSMSSDSSSGVFLGSLYTKTGTSTYAVSPGLSVYRADTKNVSTYSALLAALQAAKPVALPTDADYFRQFPAIAPSGAILYSSLPKSGSPVAGIAADGIPADSWNIYMIAADGTKKMITEGLRPKWIDGTHFAFLKNDGIYTYDLANATEQKAWDITRQVTVVTGFDVSDDGQFAALTDPVSGTAVVIRALNWAGNILSSYATLPVTATNPVFAPDDRYLAMITLQQNSKDPKGALIPELRYYSLASQRFIDQSIPFNPKSTSSIYMTDWR